MSCLFEPYDFCGIHLHNRFVRSATMENMATSDRLPSEDLMQLYETMARGEVGMIITSAVRPDRDWDPHANSKGMCLDREEMLPAFGELVDRVHQLGSGIAIQLGSFFRFKDRFAAAWLDTPNESRYVLTAADIRQIVERFGQAGQLSREAGFDAVQINAAHAFPLSQFLSPAYNKRQDEYGGSTRNRARIISEIAAEIHKRTGNDFPIFIKMNVVDFCDGGIDVDEAVRIADILSSRGIAAIEASGGGIGHRMTWLGPAKKKEWKEGYLRQYAAELKSKTELPLITVGGLRSYAMMEDIIHRGQADLISMSRPLIREPQLIKRWAAGDRTPAGCISCNGCMGKFQENDAVYCVAD